MLGLPPSTEIRKVITKKTVFEHFDQNMSSERRKSLDADIARITVVNEISPASLNIAEGEEIHSFFVVHVNLRRKDYDKQNIIFIAKMFGQKLILVLEYDGQQCLAIWQTTLIQRDWTSPDNLSIHLTGLNLDKIWENIVSEEAGIQIEQGKTLDEQLEKEQKKAKLQKEIDKLEKQAWNEKQPRRKMEFVQEIKRLTEKLEMLE